MDVQEVRPGLWRWTAYHPEWRQEVGSVACAGPRDLVLIDPLLPSDDAIDALVRDVGKPVSVLVTVYWHTRSADLVARRHDARVLAPSGGRAAVRRRAPTIEAFRPGDPLPGGVHALPTARSSEVVYWLPGDPDGGLRLGPRSWLPEGTSLDALRGSLRPLLDLPVARVLVSHGDPVLRSGRAALERTLAP